MYKAEAYLFTKTISKRFFLAFNGLKSKKCNKYSTNILIIIYNYIIKKYFLKFIYQNKVQIIRALKNKKTEDINSQISL